MLHRQEVINQSVNETIEHDKLRKSVLHENGPLTNSVNISAKEEETKKHFQRDPQQHSKD